MNRKHKERVLEVAGAVASTLLLLLWVWYTNYGAGT